MKAIWSNFLFSVPALPSLKLFLMLYSGLPVFLFFSYLQNLISQLPSYNHHSNFQVFWQFFEKPMIEVCMLMLSRSEAFLCWEGLSFMLIITKKKTKKRIRSIRAKNEKYVARKYTRTRATLARKYTNRIIRVKRWQNKYEIFNQIF